MQRLQDARLHNINMDSLMNSELGMYQRIATAMTAGYGVWF